MAFTPNNDVNILQSSDTATVGAGLGDDRYVLDSSLLTPGQTITISDVAGANVLQLVGGLTITGSQVTSNAISLTLSNGSTVNILGADTFSYQTGGNAINGQGGTTQNFSDFVTQSLGAMVPAPGAPATTGGTVTVNMNGGTSGGGVPQTAFTLTEAKDSVNEGEANVFTVTLAQAASADTTVTFQLAAGDASAANQGTNTTNLNDFAAGSFNPVTVTIPAGSTTATFSVTSLLDGLTELAETYSVSATVNGVTLSETTTVLDGAGNNVGQTFALTTGVDAGNGFVGGSGADTFIAGTVNNIQTLSAGDTLDGGAGTDTLNATVVGTPTAGFKTSNIEIFNVNNANNAASIVDVGTSSGFTQIWSDGSTNGLTVNNVGDDAVLGARNTSQAFTVGFDVGALADKAVDVALMNAGIAPQTANATANNTNGAVALTTTGDTTATSVNINSMGTAPNRVNIADVAGTALKDVNISGSASDTYVAISGDNGSVQNINSTATGNVVILAGGDTAGSQASDIRTVNTLGGNDRYVTNAGGFDQNDKVNLGAGADQLELHGNGAFALTSTSDNVKGSNAAMGVETLILDVWTDGNANNGGAETVTFKASDFTGINSFVITDTFTDGAAGVANVLDADVEGAITVTGVQDADMFTVGTATLAGLSFNKNVGATDTKLNLTLANDLDDGKNNAQTLTTDLTDISLAITHKSSGTDTTLNGNLALTTDSAKVVVTGSTDAAMNLNLTGQGKGVTLDVSGVTGVVNTNFFDGGDNGSTLITTSAKDQVTGGTGNDTIRSGAGDDIIFAETGNDTVEAGAGNDTVNVTTLTSADNIDGGEGIDLLGINEAVTAAQLVNVKNFEGLQLNTGATIDVVQVDANNKISTVQVNNGGTNVLNNVSNDFATLTIGQAGDGSVVTVDRLIDNTSNALAFTASNVNSAAADMVDVDLTIADEETLTITQGTLEVADSLDVDIKNGGDLNSITVSGGQNQTTITGIDTQLGSTGSVRTLTVNATALTSTGGTGFVANFAGADKVAVNVTGTTVNGNTLTGGDNDDVLTGGTVNDTLTGGLGADTINGGTGTDTFVAGVMSGAVDGGVGDIAGMVINLSSSAITAAMIDANEAQGTKADNLAGTGTAVAPNTTAYLFDDPAVSGSNNRDTLTSIENATGTNGNDQIYGSSAANVLNGGDGADFISGGDGNDTIDGGAGNDTITGGAGNDTITGGAGNDTITGGAGNDTITGGAGIDTITTGAGTDTVSFTGVNTAADRDTVTDFTVGTDILGLDVDYTTVATAAGNQAVIEDEAVAAANANAADYDLAAALVANTNAVDLVTLDTAVLANIANANLANATNGTELLKALVAAGAGNTATGINVDNANDSFYIATDDGTNGYLYIANDANGNGSVAAAEITLVGTFTGSLIDGVVAAQTIMVA